MKDLFYLFLTISSIALLSSCSTYQYELGTMSTEDQAEKVALLNQQEKKQLRLQKAQSRAESNQENNLLTEADKNSLLRIKESRTRAIEDMAQENEKRDIKVKSYDGYEAAYFYQAVNASNGTTTKAREESQMNLLLINKNRKRNSYRSTDPYSVSAKIYLVKPEKAKPGFDIKNAEIIRQVSSVRLSAEDKKVIELPMGFYMVQFVRNGEIVSAGPVSLIPQHKVSISAEDGRGLNIPLRKIDGYAIYNQ